MAEQARQLEFVHTSQFTTPVAEEYAQRIARVCRREFSRRRGVLHLRRFGVGRNRTETGAAISGGDRTNQTLPGAEPDAELSRLNSRRSFGFRQQAAARNLFAHGAGVRARRNSLLLSLQLRLHRRLPQLRTGVRSRVGESDRSRERRGGSIHLRTGQRSHAGRGRSAAWISAERLPKFAGAMASC